MLLLLLHLPLLLPTITNALPYRPPAPPSTHLETIADLPAPSSDSVAVELNDFIYLFGGCGTNQVFQGWDSYGFPFYGCNPTDRLVRYDPKNDVYALLPVGRRPRISHMMVAIGTKLFLMGGNDGLTDALITDVDVFDTVTNTWSLYGTFTSAPRDAASFTLDGKTIYVVGGYLSDFTSLNTMWSHTPGVDSPTTWHVMNATLNIPRGDIWASVWANKVYVMGGFVSQNNYEPEATMEIYDASAMKWTLETEPDQIKAGERSSGAYNNYVYFFGGETKDGDLSVPIELIAQYVPDVDAWHQLGEMDMRRFRAPVVGWRNFMYVFGGQTTMVGIYNTTTSYHALIQTGIKLVITDPTQNLRDQLVAMHGSGTSAGRNFLATSLDLIQAEATVPIRATFRAVGNYLGETELVAAFNDYLPGLTTDFAILTTPLSKDSVDALFLHDHEVVQIPIGIMLLSIIYNVKLQNGDEVKLDACTLGGIMSGTITTWGQTPLTNLNPFLQNVGNMPINIVCPFNASTGLVADEGMATLLAYLNHQTISGSSCDPNVFNPATFDSGAAMATMCTTRIDDILGYVMSTPGSIGATFLMQNSWMAPPTVQQAFITNLAGHALKVALANANGSLDSYNPLSTSGADLSTFSAFDAPGDSTWPIATVLWFIARRDVTWADQTGALVQGYCRWLLHSDWGQTVMLSFNVFPLPEKWRAVSASWCDTFEVSAFATDFAFEGYLDWLNGTTQRQAVVGGAAGTFVFSSARASGAQLELDAIRTRLATVDVRSQITAATVDTQTNNVAIAGLVIATFAFLLALYAVIKVSNMSKSKHHHRMEGLGENNGTANKPFVSNTPPQPAIRGITYEGAMTEV